MKRIWTVNMLVFSITIRLKWYLFDPVLHTSSFFKLHTDWKFLSFGCVVYAIGQLYWTEVIEILIKKIKIVFLQILQIIFSLNSTKKCSKRMLRKWIRIFLINFNSRFESFLRIGCYFQNPIKQFFRWFSINPIPYIFGRQIILA